MDLNLRIAGEAGQGVQTTGSLLAGVLSSLGVHLLLSQYYMSRIRGGLNWVDLRVADRALFSVCETADLLVALTPEGVEALQGELAPGGLLLYDGEGQNGGLGIPFSTIARETAKSPLMANVVAAGAIFTVLGLPLDALNAYLVKQFGRKGQEVVDANLHCARRGAEAATAFAGRLAAPKPMGAPATLHGGAEAIGLGAATAGVKLVFAYPMTPGTATLTWFAANAHKFGIVVEQAEDEIAAVNMACGAAYAGVPSFVTTSGGGFALMTEGVSLAAMMELPLVILNAQRPGPATSLPTRTGQQDLLFALHAGHGEFVRALYAPGTVQQCYEVTRHAIAQAHRYQSPVIILTDQYLQDLAQNMPPLDAKLNPIDPCLACNAGAEYQRYVVTVDGVSPRAIPGGAARVVMDSDEHTEAGHLTEDLQEHLRQQDKRMRKGAGLAADALAPEYYGPVNANHLLIAWGSSYGPCREAVDQLPGTAMLHFAQVWPLDVEALKQLLSGRRITVVEGNCTGQFAQVLRLAGLALEYDSLLRYDGMPLTAEYLVERLEA